MGAPDDKHERPALAQEDKIERPCSRGLFTCAPVYRQAPPGNLCLEIALLSVIYSPLGAVFNICY